MGQRAAIVVVCAISLLACCALAWWQWQRFSSAGGTFQNLGYVLQWPLFGLFPAFMFWRIRKLRREAEQGEDAPVAVAEPSLVARPAPVQPVAVPEDDDELAAYNRYLAQLNAGTGDQTPTQKG